MDRLEHLKKLQPATRARLQRLVGAPLGHEAGPAAQELLKELAYLFRGLRIRGAHKGNLFRVESGGRVLASVSFDQGVFTVFSGTAGSPAVIPMFWDDAMSQWAGRGPEEEPTYSEPALEALARAVLDRVERSQSSEAMNRATQDLLDRL